jgi:hypothetical protein
MARTPARHMLLHLGRAAAIAIPALLAMSAAIPAQAQVSLSIHIGFDDFHSRLAPYGTWSNHPRWGQVWHPRAARDFRPYYDGHWVNTREYGWMWVSDERWGDVAYHYGRWVRDPREGWLWVPGYVWAPSWVVWRSGGGNIGWFPMPPGDDYYGDGAYRGSFDNNQFLSLWIFVGEDHFGDRNFRTYAVPQRDYSRFIGQTRDLTNYTTVNNYVVNRSIDANRLPQATRQRLAPVAARSVIRDAALVTPAPAGRQIEQRERQQRPIPATRTVPGGTAAPAPNVNQPDRQGRGNQQNDRAAPQAPHTAPAAPAIQPTAPANPVQDRAGRGNPQPDRGAAAPAPVRRPDNASPAQDRGAARGDRQNENAGDPKASDEQKNGGRRPN